MPRSPTRGSSQRESPPRAWVRSGRAPLVLLLLLFASPSHGQTLFADDFETGTLLAGQSPPGKWSNIFGLGPGNSITAPAAAAHRGGFGMRMTDVNVQTGADCEGELTLMTGSPGANVHTRMWFRLTSSNDQAITEFLAASVVNGALSNILSLELRFPGAELWLSGAGPTTYQPQDTQQRLTVGTWYLLETDVLGIGTAAGIRRLRVNGVTVGERTGIDWSGLSLDRLKAAELWADDRRFTGVLDYDDFRVSTSPPATRLQVDAPASAESGACVPVTVSLRDSVANALAVAPYAFDAALGVTGVAGGFHSDPACATPVGVASFSVGQSSAAGVYFRPQGEGTATLGASFVDFLPGSGAVTVGPAGPDGGQGTADGGGQGTPDGGVPGEPFACEENADCPSGRCVEAVCAPPCEPGDEACLETLRLKLGCGCAQSGAPLLWALGVLLFAACRPGRRVRRG